MKFNHLFSTLILTGLILFQNYVIAQDCKFEQIDQFDVYVKFLDNGDVEITEEITVCATGNQIKRGIFREIPSRYVYGPFKTEHRKLEFTKILRNGEPEPHKVDRYVFGARLYIGDKNVFVDGVQKYSITYLTDRAVRPVQDSDSLLEFYWNVTGNYWPFMILKARIFIPYNDAVPIVQFAAYLGESGSDNQNGWTHYIDSTGGYWVAETKPDYILSPQNGFTIAVAWNKHDFVKWNQGFGDKDWKMRDFGLEIWTGLGMAGAFVIMLLIWLFVGKDPFRRATAPQFDIPDNMEPAMLGYILRMGYHKNLFSATIVNLAAHKKLKISKPKRRFELTRLKSGAPVSSIEQETLDKLVSSAGSQLIIDRSKSTGEKILAAQNNLKGSLEERGKKYFHANYGWGALALLMLLGSIAMGIIKGYHFEGEVAVFAGMVIMSIGVLYHMFKWIFRRIWHNLFGSGWGYKLLAIVPATAALCILVYFLQRDSQTTISPIFAAQLGLIICALDIYFFLIKKPTKLGTRIMEEGKGLKLYLTTAEKKMLDFLHCPEKNIETYEKYLPYAIALGVESKWNEKFSKELKTWEKSTGDTSFDYRDYSSYSTSGGIGSAISSAASFSASSGSSGSGGGGSSGGGGGGGGGGGW